MTNWIKFCKLSQTAKEPRYQTAGAAGMDLHASEAAIIAIGQTAVIATGIAIELPPGTMAEIRPRGGIARRGILVHSPPIDEDYRGDLGIIVTNLSPGGNDFVVNVGDRIAQLVVLPVINAILYDGPLSETERGNGRFGSTGMV